MAILSMPSTLRAGDSWSFTAAPASYQGPDWSLSVQVCSASTSTDLPAVWDAENELHTITVTPAESLLFAAGRYTWYLIALNETDALRATLESGTVEILPDPVTATPTAPPSDARVTLTAIDATIKERAIAGQADLSRTGFKDRFAEYDNAGLLKLRALYASIVAAEQAEANRAAGLTAGVVQVQFS